MKTRKQLGDFVFTKQRQLTPVYMTAIDDNYDRYDTTDADDGLELEVTIAIKIESFLTVRR